MTDAVDRDYTIKDSITEGLIGSVILAPFIVGIDIIASMVMSRVVSQTEIVMSCLITFAIVMAICGITYLANKKSANKADLEIPPKQ